MKNISPVFIDLYIVPEKPLVNVSFGILDHGNIGISRQDCFYFNPTAGSCFNASAELSSGKKIGRHDGETGFSFFEHFEVGVVYLTFSPDPVIFAGTHLTNFFGLWVVFGFDHSTP